MFTFKPFMGAACLLLLVASCNNAKKSETYDATISSPSETSNEKDKNSLSTNTEIPVAIDEQQFSDTTTNPTNTGGVKQSKKTPSQVAVYDWTKKIIKNASMKLEVKDFKGYNDLINIKLKQYGAYIAQEDNNLNDGMSETVVAIKVPVQHFDELINDLSNTDVKVIEKSIKANDVTGDIVDTRSRLEAKKEMRLKYLEFLKQSKNMTEVLQVQDEINSIQEEIEAASGRFASLNTQAAYSTIQITYYKSVTGFKVPDDKPSFFSKVADAFSIGAGWLANLFLGLLSIWPFLVGVCAAIFIYKKSNRKKVVQQNV